MSKPRKPRCLAAEFLAGGPPRVPHELQDLLSVTDRLVAAVSEGRLCPACVMAQVMSINHALSKFLQVEAAALHAHLVAGGQPDLADAISFIEEVDREITLQRATQTAPDADATRH